MSSWRLDALANADLRRARKALGDVTGCARCRGGEVWIFHSTGVRTCVECGFLPDSQTVASHPLPGSAPPRGSAYAHNRGPYEDPHHYDHRTDPREREICDELQREHGRRVARPR